MNETPMLYTDLVSPNSLSKYHASAPFTDGQDVIPIKAWAKGTEESFEFSEGMEAYFAKAFTEGNDENGEEEEGDEEGDEYEDENEQFEEEADEQRNGENDADFDFEDFEPTDGTQQNYLQSSTEYTAEAFEDFEGAEGEENEEEEGEEQYENEDEAYEEEEDNNNPPSSKKDPSLTNLIGLISSYEDMKEEILRDSIQSRGGKLTGRNSSAQQEDKLLNEEDTAAIVNEYKGLLAYITSPRDEAGQGHQSVFDNDFETLFPSQNQKKHAKEHKATPKKPVAQIPQKNKKNNNNLAVDNNSNNQKNLYFQAGLPINESDNDYYESQQEEEEEEEEDDEDNEGDDLMPIPQKKGKQPLQGKQQQQTKKKKNKSNQKNKFYSQEPTLVKKSHPLIRKKESKSEAEKLRMLETQKKLRAQLQETANKRKAEEEELLALAAKAQEKRKKFKEVGVCRNSFELRTYFSFVIGITRESN
jgi:hypothetical protein